MHDPPGSADQISNELSDLIGTDFDRSFVDWLFDQVKVHYPEPASASSSSSSAPASTPAPAPAPAPASALAPAFHRSPAGPASDRNNAIPSRPAAPLGGGGAGGGGRQVFGAAVSGMKRGARDRDHEDGGGGGGGGERQPQRARYDGPAGGGPRGSNNGGNSGRSLFDRVNGNNPQFAPGRTVGPVNNTGMPQPAFDAVSTFFPLFLRRKRERERERVGDR